jgi:acyl-CoA thioester hydrolase
MDCKMPAQNSAAIAIPFVSSIMTVEKAWIDFNGHMNMAYYHLLFDRGVDDFYPTFGLTRDYIERSQHSTFLAESHIRYVKEVHVDDEVRVSTQVLGLDSKRLHLFNTLIHVREGYVSATSEDMVLSVDLSVRKVSPWQKELFDKLTAIQAAHAGLPVPEAAGRRIGMTKS